MRPNARVLIVEDDPLLALDLEDTFEGAGYQVSGTAGTVAAGLELIERDPPEIATLDYQLGKETSERLAAVLQSLDIPFCFISGRSDLISDSEHPVIPKPAAPRTVLRAVEGLLAD